jgi:hypothetical protein
MGLFNKIRRILRGGKALPNEHGPRYVKLQRDEVGRWTEPEGHACNCGVGCACKSSDIYELEKAAGLHKKIQIQIQAATVDGTPASIPTDLLKHLEAEGHIKLTKPKKASVKKPSAKKKPESK